jgi:peptidyl-prolyl cis-trans isomerase D
MFDIVQKHQRTVQTILLLTIAGFALFGIASYLDFSSDAYLAKVGSHKIYSKDLDRYNAKDTSEKTALLMRLVNNQLLIQASQDDHIVVTDEQLKEAIMQVPDFMTNKKFDLNKYKNFIKYNGISANRIEEIMREQEAIDVWLKFYKNSYFIAPNITNELLDLMSKEITVEQHIISSKDFLDKVEVSQSDIEQYYKNHLNNYKIPARSQISYVEIKPENVVSKIVVNNNDIDDYLKKNPSTAPASQYHAAHILFSVDKNASAKDIEKIKNTAENILKELKTDPNKFAEYAKKYSGDKGSAVNGGDLGFFDPNTMVPEFKAKVITMKTGEISDLVKTQYGFHIIKMIAIKSGDIIQKEEARTKLIDLKAKELIKNIVNGSDISSDSSLSQIAAANNAAISSATVIIGNNNPIEDFNDSNFQQVIVSNHNDTKLHKIFVNDHAYFMVIKEFTPEKQQTINEVKDGIAQLIKLPKAHVLANKYSDEQIKDLNNGKSSLQFNNKMTVSLMSGNKDISQDTIKELFNYNGKYPYYTQTANNSGDTVIYKVSGTSINQKLLDQNKMFMPQLQEQNYMQELALFVNNLKNKYPVNLKLDKV